MNKKSQMEIMGLAIIIVIVILGLVLAMRLFGGKAAAKPDAMERQLASSFIKSALSDKFDVGCKEGVSLKDLYEDCAKPVQNKCSDVSQTKYCDSAKIVTGKLLKSTFEKRNMKYTFKVNKESDPALIVLQNPPESGCTGKDVSPSIYILPTSNGIITLYLTVCK